MQDILYTPKELIALGKEILIKKIGEIDYPLCYDPKYNRVKAIKVFPDIEIYTTKFPEKARIIIKLIDKKTFEAVLAIGETIDFITQNNQVYISDTTFHHIIKELIRKLYDMVDRQYNFIVKAKVMCENL